MRATRTRCAAFLFAVACLPATMLAGWSASAAAADGGPTPVTVTAPAGGSVMASQATGLVDQTVHVSWTGFKPSSTPVVHAASTEYVVRVYECRGTAPTGPQDCYGSSLYTYPGQSDKSAVLPDGPTNALDAATDPSGAGEVDIEVRTSAESSSLGCDKDNACSIAVVPNYGQPGKHSTDFIYATNSYMDSAWAWANHVAIPLSFAPTGQSCPLNTPSISLNGSPALERAVMSWQPVICQESGGTALNYTAIGEQAGRTQFMSGTADVGLTADPVTGISTRRFRYAPLAVNGISFAFHVDDATTGQPITSMTLTPRLVAKMLTESYGQNGYVAKGQPVANGNPATVGNPYSLFTDPEFLALNPGHSWPSTGTNPLIVSGNQDMIYELTRWLAADRATKTWLSGTPDEYGMHVNTNFKGISYPVSSLELRDPYTALSYTFVPLEGLSNVARSLVSNTPSSSSPTPDALGVHPKDPQQLPGQRALIAIVDTANAAAFNFPVAAIRNASGKDVQPTAAAITTALAAMTKTGAGTLQANPSDPNPASYPLTLVQYAMVPTAGTPTATAGRIAQFLTYAALKGQQSGVLEGGLPAGYLPLTSALHNELTADITVVSKQSDPPISTPSTLGSGTGGTTGGNSGSGDLGSSNSGFGGSTDFSTDTSGNGSDLGADGGDGGAPAGPSATSTTNAKPVVASSDATHKVQAVDYTPPHSSAGASRLVVPLLIAAAISTAIVGPLLLAVGPNGPGTTSVRNRIRRILRREDT
jgi:ABC-type phosphate transport system substrate-binding protein